MNLRHWLLTVMVLGGEPLSAQFGPLIVGGGRQQPIVDVSPGEITALFLTGIWPPPAVTDPYDVTCPCWRAQGFPLPTSLAGVSVGLRQFTDAQPIPVPILSVEGFGLGRATVVIQVPYDLRPEPLTLSGNYVNYRNQLIVTVNGVAGPPFGVILRQDMIRAMTSCAGPYSRTVPPGDYGYYNHCQAQIWHANNHRVSGEDPALPGETLVIYAFGLGTTVPKISVGTAAPDPPATAVHPPLLTFNFTPNAPLALPGPAGLSSLVMASPTFAGLVPGYAGLYQVNFQVPA